MAEIDSALNENTIAQYIQDYRDTEITYDKLHFLESDSISDDKTANKLILISSSILDKYRSDLAEHIVEKIIGVKEQSRYFYNPWALSKDLYGTTEFWHVLLELNNMYSAMEFTQEKIKVYDGSFPYLVETILSLEEEEINQNNDEIENGTEENPSILLSKEYNEYEEYIDDDYIETSNDEYEEE